MPDGLLLATARCEFAGEATAPNGYLFNDAGQVLRKFVFGDGIADLQTTKTGDIWVSYFDEGIFGNLGWKEPIGWNGLLRFDRSGEIRYRFEATDGLETIDDCYSLNVASEHETWLCYYSQFSIVRIVDNRIVQHWASPVPGSSNMAISGRAVLMQKGHRTNDWTLVQLEEKEAKIKTSRITFQTPDGKVLEARTARARQSVVWFVDNREIFRYDLRSGQSFLPL
jgi:hypothetical protein